MVEEQRARAGGNQRVRRRDGVNGPHVAVDGDGAIDHGGKRRCAHECQQPLDRVLVRSFPASILRPGLELRFDDQVAGFDPGMLFLANKVGHYLGQFHA
ncbi:hypothetical protein D9M68_582910 [compost metagenome]